MCPQSVISSCDSQTGGEVIQNGKDGCLQVQRRPPGLDAAVYGNANDEGDIEPVDVLVPIRLGHGRLCDVWLLGVIFRASVGFRGLCHA